MIGHPAVPQRLANYIQNLPIFCHMDPFHRTAKHEENIVKLGWPVLVLMRNFN